MAKELSRSSLVASKAIFAAMQALKENNGSLPFEKIIEEVQRRVTFDEWEASLQARGAIRWQSFMAFSSIAHVKAGFIVKKRRVWYLTPEGEDALKLGELALHEKARAAYIEWKKSRQVDELTEDSDYVEGEQLNNGLNMEAIEQTALEGIKNIIDKKNPYEFQDMAAALLRAMGYFTPFVAPRGKDGGVDIQAYRDPLGTVSPRIKVQVKHKMASASVQEMRQLIGLLQKDGDVGIFISTAGFTPDAVSAARSSHVHVELIDFDRFITLWQEFYQKLNDEDKSLLPLRVVYFIDQVE